MPSRSRLSSGLFMLATLISCTKALTVADLRLFKDLNRQYTPENPIKVYVAPEQDYASYLDKGKQFDLLSIRQDLINRLSEETIAATKLDFNQAIREIEVSNPFVVTDDEKQADLSIQVVVDVFDYGDKRTLGGKILRFAALGGLGLLGTGEQAVIIGSYKITDPVTKKQLYGKEDVRLLSGEGMVPRKALEKASLEFSKAVYQDLVQMKFR